MAVILYNNGHQKLPEVFNELSLDVGAYCSKELERKDNKRIYIAEYKLSEKSKKQRQARRKQRLQQEDRNKEEVGVRYEYGGF